MLLEKVASAVVWENEAKRANIPDFSLTRRASSLSPTDPEAMFVNPAHHATQSPTALKR